MGNSSFQMKEKLLKHNPMRTSIRIREMPTVTTRSERMRPAFDTLPMGSPWAWTFTSGCKVSNSFCAFESIFEKLVEAQESSDLNAGAR